MVRIFFSIQPLAYSKNGWMIHVMSLHLRFSSEYGSIYFLVQTIIIMTSWTRLINSSNNKWNIFFYWIVFCKSSFRGTCELWSIPIYTFYLYTLIKSTIPIHHPTISFSKKKKKMTILEKLQSNFTCGPVGESNFDVWTEEWWCI